MIAETDVARIERFVQAGETLRERVRQYAAGIRVSSDPRVRVIAKNLDDFVRTYDQDSADPPGDGR